MVNSVHFHTAVDRSEDEEDGASSTPPKSADDGSTPSSGSPAPEASACHRETIVSPQATEPSATETDSKSTPTLERDCRLNNQTDDLSQNSLAAEDNDEYCDSSSGSPKTSLFCSLPLDKVRTVLESINKSNILESYLLKNRIQQEQEAAKASKISKKLMCLYCERTFVTPNLKQKHVDRCHLNNVTRRSSSRIPSLNQTAGCGFCNKLNGTDYDLKTLFQHLTTEHATRYFGCLPCEDRFGTAKLLEEHNVAVHGLVVEVEEVVDNKSDVVDVVSVLPPPPTPPPPPASSSVSPSSSSSSVVVQISSEAVSDVNGIENDVVPPPPPPTVVSVVKKRSRVAKKSAPPTEALPVETPSADVVKEVVLEDFEANITVNVINATSLLKATTTTDVVAKESETVEVFKKPALKKNNKKIAVKSTKFGIKNNLRTNNMRTTRLQVKLSIEKSKKPKKPIKSKRVVEEKKAEERYVPSIESFFRVQKITDHSSDSIKLNSMTFDAVFDKAFYNRIKCNIQENLLNHIDGKLFKNVESENRISNFEQAPLSPSADLKVPGASENFGCDISLNAATPVATLLNSSQFGEDFESQIEYGAKASKKKSKTDSVTYKYYTRRKYQAELKEKEENRDLSKLDMWTQLVIKNRQQKIVDDQRSTDEMLQYSLCDGFKAKVQVEELNRILDRRGPFEDLLEEATISAALEKSRADSELGNENSNCDAIKAIVEEMLNKIDDNLQDRIKVEDSPLPNEPQDLEDTDMELPNYFNLVKSPSKNNDSLIDISDRITLICSSQETENFESPSSYVRPKGSVIELTGEWTRPKIYICAACGTKLPNMKYLLDHKNLMHQNIWCQHYEFVGKQSELYRHLSIPGLGKVGAVEDYPMSKVWVRSDARTCTKCDKQCNSLAELHRHILECGGDWTWMLARKKCKYRPYGSRSRRKRLRGLHNRIFGTKENTDNKEPRQKRKYNKRKFDGPRQKPSDAETIQRMLANLPAKRTTRKLVSMRDGMQRPRKRTCLPLRSTLFSQKQVSKSEKIEQNHSKVTRSMVTERKLTRSLANQKLKNAIKSSRVTLRTLPRRIQSKEAGTESAGKEISTVVEAQVTRPIKRQSVRKINKVLSSAIIDTNKTLLRKRKLVKALTDARTTRLRTKEANDTAEPKAETEKVAETLKQPIRSQTPAIGVKQGNSEQKPKQNGLFKRTKSIKQTILRRIRVEKTKKIMLTASDSAARVNDIIDAVLLQGDEQVEKLQADEQKDENKPKDNPLEDKQQESARLTRSGKTLAVPTAEAKLEEEKETHAAKPIEEPPKSTKSIDSKARKLIRSFSIRKSKKLVVSKEKDSLLKETDDQPNVTVANPVIADGKVAAEPTKKRKIASTIKAAFKRVKQSKKTASITKTSETDKNTEKNDEFPAMPTLEKYTPITEASLNDTPATIPVLLPVIPEQQEPLTIIENPSEEVPVEATELVVSAAEDVKKNSVEDEVPEKTEDRKEDMIVEPNVVSEAPKIVAACSVPKVAPPIVAKSKLKRPFRGLNDCIAMLTSKLQQKEKIEQPICVLPDTTFFTEKPQNGKLDAESIVPLATCVPPKPEDIQEKSTDITPKITEVLEHVSVTNVVEKGIEIATTKSSEVIAIPEVLDLKIKSQVSTPNASTDFSDSVSETSKFIEDFEQIIPAKESTTEGLQILEDAVNMASEVTKIAEKLTENQESEECLETLVQSIEDVEVKSMEDISESDISTLTPISPNIKEDDCKIVTSKPSISIEEPLEIVTEAEFDKSSMDVPMEECPTVEAIILENTTIQTAILKESASETENSVLETHFPCNLDVEKDVNCSNLSENNNLEHENSAAIEVELKEFTNESVNEVPTLSLKELKTAKKSKRRKQRKIGSTRKNIKVPHKAKQMKDSLNIINEILPENQNKFKENDKILLEESDPIVNEILTTVELNVAFTETVKEDGKYADMIKDKETSDDNEDLPLSQYFKLETTVRTIPRKRYVKRSKIFRTKKSKMRKPKTIKSANSLVDVCKENTDIVSEETVLHTSVLELLDTPNKELLVFDDVSVIDENKEDKITENEPVNVLPEPIQEVIKSVRVNKRSKTRKQKKTTKSTSSPKLDCNKDVEKELGNNTNPDNASESKTVGEADEFVVPVQNEGNQKTSDKILLTEKPNECREVIDLSETVTEDSNKSNEKECLSEENTRVSNTSEPLDSPLMKQNKRKANNIHSIDEQKEIFLKQILPIADGEESQKVLEELIISSNKKLPLENVSYKRGKKKSNKNCTKQSDEVREERIIPLLEPEKMNVCENKIEEAPLNDSSAFEYPVRGRRKNSKRLTLTQDSLTISAEKETILDNNSEGGNENQIEDVTTQKLNADVEKFVNNIDSAFTESSNSMFPSGVKSNKRGKTKCTNKGSAKVKDNIIEENTISTSQSEKDAMDNRTKDSIIPFSNFDSLDSLSKCVERKIDDNVTVAQENGTPDNESKLKEMNPLPASSKGKRNTKNSLEDKLIELSDNEVTTEQRLFDENTETTALTSTTKPITPKKSTKTRRKNADISIISSSEFNTANDILQEGVQDSEFLKELFQYSSPSKRTRSSMKTNSELLAQTIKESMIGITPEPKIIEEDTNILDNQKNEESFELVHPLKVTKHTEISETSIPESATESSLTEERIEKLFESICNTIDNNTILKRDRTSKKKKSNKKSISNDLLLEPFTMDEESTSEERTNTLSVNTISFPNVSNVTETKICLKLKLNIEKPVVEILQNEVKGVSEQPCMPHNESLENIVALAKKSSRRKKKSSLKTSTKRTKDFLAEESFPGNTHTDNFLVEKVALEHRADESQILDSNTLSETAQDTFESLKPLKSFRKKKSNVSSNEIQVEIPKTIKSDNSLETVASTKCSKSSRRKKCNSLAPAEDITNIVVDKNFEDIVSGIVESDNSFDTAPTLKCSKTSRRKKSDITIPTQDTVINDNLENQSKMIDPFNMPSEKLKAESEVTAPISKRSKSSRRKKSDVIVPNELGSTDANVNNSDTSTINIESLLKSSENCKIDSDNYFEAVSAVGRHSKYSRGRQSDISMSAEPILTDAYVKDKHPDQNKIVNSLNEFSDKPMLGINNLFETLVPIKHSKSSRRRKSTKLSSAPIPADLCANDGITYEIKSLDSENIYSENSTTESEAAAINKRSKSSRKKKIDTVIFTEPTTLDTVKSDDAKKQNRLINLPKFLYENCQANKLDDKTGTKSTLIENTEQTKLVKPNESFKTAFIQDTQSEFSENQNVDDYQDTELLLDDDIETEVEVEKINETISSILESCEDALASTRRKKASKKKSTIAKKASFTLSGETPIEIHLNDENIDKIANEVGVQDQIIQEPIISFSKAIQLVAPLKITRTYRKKKRKAGTRRLVKVTRDLVEESLEKNSVPETRIEQPVEIALPSTNDDTELKIVEEVTRIGREKTLNIGYHVENKISEITPVVEYNSETNHQDSGKENSRKVKKTKGKRGKKSKLQKSVKKHKIVITPNRIDVNFVSKSNSNEQQIMSDFANKITRISENLEPDLMEEKDLPLSANAQDIPKSDSEDEIPLSLFAKTMSSNIAAVEAPAESTISETIKDVSDVYSFSVDDDFKLRDSTTSNRPKLKLKFDNKITGHAMENSENDASLEKLSEENVPPLSEQTPTKEYLESSLITTPDMADENLMLNIKSKFKVKIGKQSKKKAAKSSVRKMSVEKMQPPNEEPVICEICNKTFVRPASLTLHKKTLTHIAKLSELEAIAAAEKNKFEEELIEEVVKEVKTKPDKVDRFFGASLSLTSVNDNLKLADIINDVLDKPVAVHDGFSNLVFNSALSDDISQSEKKRYRSLGERKSFDSDNVLLQHPKMDDFPPSTVNEGLLTKQISMLENIILEETSKLKYIDDAISLSSNQSNSNQNDSSITKPFDSSQITFSHNTNIISSFIKPTEENFIKPPQNAFEEISEDGRNHYDDLRSRKILNRDEELFLECCSLLKSGSEISNNSKKSMKNIALYDEYNKYKQCDEPDWLEEKNISEDRDVNEDKTVSNEFNVDNSRIDTPLGDSFGMEDWSGSNSMSGDWIAKTCSMESDDVSTSKTSGWLEKANEVKNNATTFENYFAGETASQGFDSCDSKNDEENTKLTSEIIINNAEETEDDEEDEDYINRDMIEAEVHLNKDDCNAATLQQENGSNDGAPVDENFKLTVVSRFGGLMAKALTTKLQDAISKNSEKSRSKRSSESTQTSITDYAIPVKKLKHNDSKKMPTKGALKVFEGLKVSIPTGELNMDEVLNCSPKSKKLELGLAVAESTKEIEPVKDTILDPAPPKKKKTVFEKFGNKLGLKVTKKRGVPKTGQKKRSPKSKVKIITSNEFEPHVHDIYDFEETQDNTDIFTTNSLSFKSYRSKTCEEKKEPKLVNEEKFDSFTFGEVNSNSSLSTSVSSAPSKCNSKNSTKKKCMIMGRIFKNALKSKSDEATVEDCEEIVKRIPPQEITPPSEPIESIVDDYDNVMTETEMNFLFDKLLNENPARIYEEAEKQPEIVEEPIAPPPKSVKVPSNKHKPKQKKRRHNSTDSTDCEFSLKSSKASKKKTISTKRVNRKKDDTINLEQELKECIGVAGRKSQRKCTSGKQNVLVEYWSSDDSAFEAFIANTGNENLSEEQTFNENSEFLNENSEFEVENTIQQKSEGIVPDISEIVLEEQILEKLPEETETVSRNEEEGDVDERFHFESETANPCTEINRKDKKQKRRKSMTKREKPKKHRKKCTSESETTPSTTSTVVTTQPITRRKRSAADTLYYWSSSSDDEFQDFIEVKPIREEEDDDRPMQHGWIVGDSPKKLVTMLAQAKGKKVESECVKEIGPKKRSTL